MSRTRLLFPTVAMVASASLLFACSDSSTGPAPPVLEEVEPGTVVFLSELNEENGAQGTNNWSSFAEWDVIAGCVDLHGNGFIDIWPNNGIYIDLDGTCMQGGTLQSKEPMTLLPGEYMLEFWLAGNNRIDAPDTVLVSFGALHQDQIVMQRRDEFRHFEQPLSVTEETSAFLSFQNLGGDDHGAMLDLVRVRARN